jgi:hypothetical protein
MIISIKYGKTMKNNICQSVLLIVTSFFLLFGCTTYNTKRTLEQTRDNINLAEKYDSSVYAQVQVTKAERNIISTNKMLLSKRPEKAFEFAEMALLESSEALRISRSSVTAILLKEARDALRLVDLNAASSENNDIYMKLIEEVRISEQMFISDRFEKCISASGNALNHAEILLAPLKKKADLKFKEIESVSEEKSNEPEYKRKLQEARMEYKIKNYKRAILILQNSGK